MKSVYCIKCKAITPFNKAENKENGDYICEGCGAIVPRSCPLCGLYTWACGCGGHCYNAEEHEQWFELFGKGKFKPIDVMKPSRRRKFHD